MIRGKSVLAVVPARSGSKGVPHKNMRKLRGETLIARAGRTLAKVDLLDARVISTDSPEYADEGRRHGLDAPFLRPADLSGDTAGSVETMQHALLQSEAHYGRRFDLVVIAEPTSPLRTPEDVERTLTALVETDAPSAITVSRLDAKYHPRKLLQIEDERISYYHAEGDRVRYRQMLDTLYWRNGLCYALTRACLMDAGKIIAEGSLPVLIDRPVVNIDDALEIEIADLLL